MGPDETNSQDQPIDVGGGSGTPPPPAGFAFAPKSSRSSAAVPKPTLPPPTASGTPGLSVGDYLKAQQEGVNLVAPRGPASRSQQQVPLPTMMPSGPPPPPPVAFDAPPPPPEVADTAEQDIRASRVSSSRSNLALPPTGAVPPPSLPPPPVAGLPTFAYLSDEPPHVYKQEEVTLAGIGAAAVAAVAGAILWAFLIWFLEIELGYLAIGIGVGIGYASAWYGGRGLQNGVICACLALASMMAGRFIGVQLIVLIKLEEAARRDAGGIEAYNAMRGPAGRYASISTEKELREFVLNQGYTGADDPYDIPQEQLDGFVATRGKELESFARNPIPFAEWDKIEKEKAVASARAQTTSLSDRMDIFFATIFISDIIFVIFGVGSAFYVGKKRDGEL